MSTAARIKTILVKRLPDPVVFRLSPLLYRRQEPELGELRSIVPPGRTAVDIGGWLGPWTRELARWCPSVHTFEPQPDLADYLRRVVPPNVTVHECAVSNRSGVQQLVVPKQDGGNALASLAGDSTPTTDADNIVHEVEVVRLDDLDLGDVGFIKIDVEGREQQVLEGARRTIEQNQPRVLLEAEQRHIDFPLDELFGQLDTLDFSGWYLQGGRWNPLSEFDLQRDQLDRVDDVTNVDYINNFLFIPQQDAPPGA